MMREIAELEAFDRECAAENSRRRQLEQQHRQRAAAASGEVAALRESVVEALRAVNTFAEAMCERVEQQDAEITALRGRLERGLTKTPRSKKAATKLPNFLPSRMPRTLS
jgi:hypothetical protein